MLGRENVVTNNLSRGKNDSDICEVVFGVNTMQSDLETLVCCQDSSPTLRAVRPTVVEGTDVNTQRLNKEETILFNQKNRLRLNAARVLTRGEYDSRLVAVIPRR